MAKPISTVGISEYLLSYVNIPIYLLNKEETRQSEILSYFKVDPSVLKLHCDIKSSFASLILCQCYYMSCVLIINQFVTRQVRNTEY